MLSKEWREIFFHFFCLVTGLYLIQCGFHAMGKRHTLELIEKNLPLFRSEKIQIDELNYFRGDYLISFKHDEEIFRWTFNRTTGVLIPWGSKELKYQKNEGL